ncbi:CC0125/CC1285 family lipoprotein [Microbulbifer sp. JMSA003]|uniref:CC0125/CC1285 family lipoprotein n=1 Tax=Microbulbifer sp. JMSA003 TaxID=3243369 RepID=UPI00403910D9
MKLKSLMIFSLVAVLAGCATPYQNSAGSFTGGHSVKHLEGDIYRVGFYGNGYTTKETVQTYWLYRCAEVAIENGFEGFEILSHITLTQSFDIEQFFAEENPYKKVQVYYIPMHTAPKPEIVADIRLLNPPYEVNPPKVFNASELKAVLDPYVNAEKKCGSGNVCEHVHKYLHPEGTFDSGI